MISEIVQSKETIISPLQNKTLQQTLFRIIKETKNL